MPRNECIHLYRPGKDISGVNNAAAVTGKTFAVINDAPATNLITSAALINVRTAGARAVPVGVFAMDYARGSVCTLFSLGVVPVTAGARVTAGNLVETDASGRVIPYTDGYRVGIALDTVESGADCPVKLLI